MRIVQSSLDLPSGSCAVYGAGRQGHALARLLKLCRPDIRQVCFFDDAVSGDGVCAPEQSVWRKIDWIVVAGSEMAAMARPLAGFHGEIFAFESGQDVAQCILPEETAAFEEKARKVCDLLPKNEQEVYMRLFAMRCEFDRHREAILFPVPGRQYFDWIHVERVEYLLEGGAQLGHTARQFAEKCPRLKAMHSFEPNPDFCRKARDLAANFPDIRFHEIALSQDEGSGLFTDEGACGHLLGNNIRTGARRCPVTSVDRFVEKHRVPGVDLIKLDIEGGERLALQGARETIRSFRPQLAVCLYHSKTDFVEIPLFLKQLVPDYDFHIGHYSQSLTETVLYAKVARSGATRSGDGPKHNS